VKLPPQASSLQAAIKAKYGMSAALKEGSGGVFFVDIDGKRVWDNQITYRFPEDAEIFTEIDKLKT
jgi:predicted Rdx family selenoprotein